MSRPGGTISCVPRSDSGADHSVLVLDLSPNPAQAHRLDQALFAAGNLRRALTCFGLARLRDLRQSPEWLTARELPTGLDAKGKVADAPARKSRNEALNAARLLHRLTERDFGMVALALRRESHWIAEHAPSSSALAISHEVWEVFERHLFAGGGLPRVRAPRLVTHLPGSSRDEGRGAATPKEVERAEARGKNAPKERHPAWAGLTLQQREGGLVLRLSPCRDRGRRLEVPVVLSRPGDPDYERECHYLDHPDAWRAVSLERRVVRGRPRYEAHLVARLTPYRTPGLYDAVPGARVGLDLGVSSLAAVGLEDGRVTAALLVRPSAEERARERDRALRRRRAQRALDRSRRNTNPKAFGPDKKGRPHRGSYLPGHRLTTSKSYRARAARLADEDRRRTAERTRRRNELARTIVTEMGADLVTEDVSVRPWQRRWGRSILAFAPGELQGAIGTEAKLAGGPGVTRVPSSLALTATCHCGARTAKSLAQRAHHCLVCDNTPVQRDLHSALLAGCVRGGAPSFYLDVPYATSVWARGAEGPLTAASRRPGVISRQSSKRRSSAQSGARRDRSSRRSTDPLVDLDGDHVVTSGGGHGPYREDSTGTGSPLTERDLVSPG